MRVRVVPRTSDRDETSSDTGSRLSLKNHKSIYAYSIPILAEAHSRAAELAGSTVQELDHGHKCLYRLGGAAQRQVRIDGHCEHLTSHDEASHLEHVTFVTRLEDLDIPAQIDAYGPGTHTWPYFERSLHDAMPMLLEALEG